MKRQSWRWLREVLFCPAVTEVTGSLSHPSSPSRGREPADVMGTPAGFPASVSLLASISPRLPRHPSPESVIAFSFICIYFPPPFSFHPFSSLRLYSSISSSLLALHPCSAQSEA
ncbi:hypothetical protein CgunFtcFv8_011799 [Champsocephalus gunnari]|uniref:Uncharacterized protein n=1 Tax=Champsocephalus gunnari TaxID=52237 RepID=A0AAN8D7G0_CHAGU|nr:hypothetical protein CgunFtcFv8_011799 [Champsocephalus gunnari]